MDNRIVREAKISDAEGIAKIHVETWQYAYKGQLPDSYLDSLSVDKHKESWKKNISNPLPKTKVFVGEIDSKIVGFCAVGACRDDDATDTIGELFAIYIDASSMNKGVGSALMKQGLEYLKEAGFKNATLWVLTSNQKTREFYEHKGWSADGKTKTDQREDFALYETRYAIDLGQGVGLRNLCIFSISKVLILFHIVRRSCTNAFRG